MLDFLRTYRNEGKYTMHLPNLAERGNDQTALHYVYLNLTQYPTLDVHIDSSNRYFLQLWTCKGNRSGGFSYRQRGGGFEYCHDHTHKPLDHVQVGSDGGVVVNETKGGIPVGHLQHPIFIHSNGYHFKMGLDMFAPMLEAYGDPARVNGVLDRPVLLVDSLRDGKIVPCAVASLGWLLNASRNPEGAPTVPR